MDPNYARPEPVGPVMCSTRHAGRQAGSPSRKELADLLSIASAREVQHPSRLAGEREEGGKGMFFLGPTPTPTSGKCVFTDPRCLPKPLAQHYTDHRLDL